MKKRKLPAILCSAVLAASLALCSVPAAAETETPVPSQNLDLRSISSFKDLLSLADRFVSPFALYEGEKQYCYLGEEPCDNINCYFHFKDTGRAKNCIMTEDIMTSTSKEYYLCDVCDAEAKQKIPSLW